MPITVPCPYCNAPVPVTQGEQRVICPRCEETVTVGDAAMSSPNAAIDAAIQTNAGPGKANRAIAGLVVAVMLGMAALGLAFALRTQPFRRANDTKGAQPPELVVESKPAPPAEWPGLGHLPDDVQVIAGIRVAAAKESASGRAMLAALGISDTNQARVLGLELDAIEHAMIGASLRALPPRVTVVVDKQGRRRITNSGSEIRRVTEHHGKTLLRQRLWPNGPDGVMWEADPHTLVAALLPEDFDRVPAKPQAGLARFAAPLPDLITQRVDPAALAWLVAAVDDKTPVLGLAASMLPLPPAERDAVSKLETLAVSVRANGAKLDLTAHIHSRDAIASATIAAAVTESLTKAGVQAASRVRPENWQEITVTADADQLTAWIAGLRGR
jgi:hypothetical protein